MRNFAGIEVYLKLQSTDLKKGRDLRTKFLAKFLRKEKSKNFTTEGVLIGRDPAALELPPI